MPTDEFWYGEEELLNAYIKAYFNREKYSAWIEGYYTYVAQLTATSNMWGGDNGKKAEYPPLENEKVSSKNANYIPTSNNDNKYLAQFY